MIEFIKEFGMAILWLFLGYLVGERAARKEKKNKELRRKVEELEDDGRFKEKS